MGELRIKACDPRRFSDPHDKAQWGELKSLPNIVYTDGNGFSLALARRLDLDEPDQRIVYADGVVRARLQMGKRGLTDQRQARRRKAVELRELAKQPFERCAELIFRSSGDSWVIQFGPGFGAEG